MSKDAVTVPTDEARRLSRKAVWHIAPLIGFLGFVAYMDRVSIAFAGPQGMNEELGLTATAFGFAVGIFTVGYVLFEVPTSGLLARFGTKKWIVRIMLTWGTIQVLVAFSPTVEVMYVLRFLLGVAEAGFTPAIYFMISVWFVRAYRPLMFVLYGALVGGSAGILGPTFATVLIELGNSFGFESFAGWRFSLAALGVLALLAAIPAGLLLNNTPATAKWMTAEEKISYTAVLAADAEGANVPHLSMRQVLKDWRPWVMGIGFFCLFYASFTISVWAPTIVLGFSEQFGTEFNVFQSSLITGIPTLIAVTGAIILGLVAGRTGRSAVLVAGAAVAGAIGCVITTFASGSTGPLVLIPALGLVALAGQSGGLYIPIVTRVFAGAGAFAAIALVNSMGAAAGFFSPIITGALADLTGNQNSGFYLMAVLLLVAAGITIFAERQARKVERDKGTEVAAVEQSIETGPQVSNPGVPVRSNS